MSGSSSVELRRGPSVQRAVRDRVRPFAILCMFSVFGCQSTAVPAPPPQIVTPLVVEEAGAPPDAGAATASLPADLEISLSRSVCLGRCPDYKVTLHADGSVAYAGRMFVAKKGVASARVPVADVAALVAQLDAAGFERLSVPSPCPKGEATDHPTHTLTLTRNGRTHTVEHYTGNMCAPEVLDALEDAVDKAAQTDAWVKCPGAKYGCPKP